jgi:hypothetical protein
MAETGEHAILDAQVLEDDLMQLPRMADWSWRTDSLVKDQDIYLKSEKWSKEQLHKNPVEFGFEKSVGHFFVRQRPDGKISVRIMSRIYVEIDGKRDWTHHSFCLGQQQLDRLELESPDLNLFCLFNL